MGACGAPAEPLPSRCLVVRPLSPGDIVLLPKAASSRLPRSRGAGVIWHQPNHPPLPCPRLCTITHPSRHRRITRRIVGAKGLAMGGTSCGLFSAPLRFLLCTAALVPPRLFSRLRRAHNDPDASGCKAHVPVNTLRKGERRLWGHPMCPAKGAVAPPDSRRYCAECSFGFGDYALDRSSGRRAPATERDGRLIEATSAW